MKRKVLYCIALLAVVFSLSSCITAALKDPIEFNNNSIKEMVEKNFSNGNWGGPENHAIYLAATDERFDKIGFIRSFLQQNPTFGYKEYGFRFGYCKYDYDFYFSEPIPVGAELKVTDYFDRKKGCATAYGIAGVDLKVTTPGLVYIDMHDKSHAYELDVLLGLQQYFVNTDWAPVIAKRIEELQNESK